MTGWFVGCWVNFSIEALTLTTTHCKLWMNFATNCEAQIGPAKPNGALCYFPSSFSSVPWSAIKLCYVVVIELWACSLAKVRTRTMSWTCAGEEEVYKWRYTISSPPPSSSEDLILSCRLHSIYVHIVSPSIVIIGLVVVLRSISLVGQISTRNCALL